MRDLFTQHEPAHLSIYHSLQQIRETFHREGRIGDSNAKLDETVKFLAIHFAYSKDLVPDEHYQLLRSRTTFTVPLLNDVFAMLARHPKFSRIGIGPIFGETPTTVFRDGDETVAFDLFATAGQAFGLQASGEKNRDILNEAFGHHVRDNFRNHIEDAQYMTPIEVVDFMVHMALTMVKNTLCDSSETLIVPDPSCGVGSFLTRWRLAYEEASDPSHTKKLKCVGQDKVERMVRLTAMNLLLTESGMDDVFLGNSINDESAIAEYNGKVDIILTNPPFGARFPVRTLQETSTKSTPFFTTSGLSLQSIESEILFLDRYLTLLRPGGLCFVVVPDGVISAKGISALCRQHLARRSEIVCVVELPSVAFAQAGTRTKTAVLGFKKLQTPRRNYKVFFAEASDLGFKVSKRKGAPIRKEGGFNQLPEVLSAFSRMAAVGGDSMGATVKAAWSEVSPGELAAWTPRRRLFDKSSLEERVPYKLIAVKELVEAAKRRGARPYTGEGYFISVLHVVGEGVLDVRGIKGYRPITPGLPIVPGEVLVSRINPRIPRVVVVPDLGREMLCSAEYEVLTPKSGVSPYLIAFLLLSSVAQEQIQSLTAGTSASHSRIKPGRVYDVLVPDLRTCREEKITRSLLTYQKACQNVTQSLLEMERVRDLIAESYLRQNC